MNKLILEQETVKAFVSGTYRTCTPEETLNKYKHLMPKLGITRLANITGLDRIGLSVVVAIRPNGRSLATAQGKGDNLAAAKASALFESIEGWHAERPIGNVKDESWQNMNTTVAVVDPMQLPMLPGSTFDLKKPIYWYEGYDLVTGEAVWVPYDMVSLNFVNYYGQFSFFERSSNGLASGNEFCEAILHGLFEVVERDAWSLWNIMTPEQQAPFNVDLQSAMNVSDILKNTLQQLEDKGIVTSVWDITSDVKLPTYYCILTENPESKQWRPVMTSSGCGTHLDPEIAFSRAVNEAIQCRATVISGSRDDQLPSKYQMVGDKAMHAYGIEMHSRTKPTYLFGQHRPKIGDTFESDINTVLARLSEVEIYQVVVVDLSREEIGIPVVKIIIPGLEGFHEASCKPGARAKRRELELTQ